MGGGVPGAARAEVLVWRFSAQDLDKFPGSPSLEGSTKEVRMKGIIAWFLGVPLFAIILLYYFGYF